MELPTSPSTRQADRAWDGSMVARRQRARRAQCSERNVIWLRWWWRDNVWRLRRHALEALRRENAKAGARRRS